MYLLVKYLLCPLLTKLSLFLSSPPFSMQREITHSSPSSVFLKGRGEGGSAFWYVNSTLLTLLYLLTHPNALWDTNGQIYTNEQTAKLGGQKGQI